MIIKLNTCDNFPKTGVYILKHVLPNQLVESKKIGNLIVHFIDKSVFSIVDLNAQFESRIQLIDELPLEIASQLSDYELEGSLFYDFGVLVDKKQNESKQNLYEIKIKSDHKTYELITNRSDVEINNTYWIGLEGALLYDGSVLEKGTIAGLYSEAMLLGEKSIYNIDSKNLLTKKEDLDQLKAGIN